MPADSNCCRYELRGQFVKKQTELWCVQAVINTLQVLKVVGPVVDPALEQDLVQLLPAVGCAARHDCSPVRSAAVSAAARLAASRPATILPHLLRSVPCLQLVIANYGAVLRMKGA